MKHTATIPLIILLLASLLHAELHVDISGGMSFESGYQYYEEEPAAQGVEWLTFDPLVAFYGSARFTVDVWKDRYRFGVTSGFMRRYELTMHSHNSSNVQEKIIGEMVAIPIIGLIEGHMNSFFFEFGLGPYITRFNYREEGLPDFSVEPLFGFLFGAGYKFPITSDINIIARGELLLNAPVKVVEYLDESIQDRIRNSRFSEYNINEFQMIIYSPVVSLGVQYDFGKSIAIPTEKLFR